MKTFTMFSRHYRKGFHLQTIQALCLLKQELVHYHTPGVCIHVVFIALLPQCSHVPSTNGELLAIENRLEIIP